MMKKLFLILMVFSLLCSFDLCTYAETVDDYLTDEMKENLPKDVLDKDNHINTDTLIDVIKTALKKALLTVGKNFMLILGIIVVCALFSACKNTISSPGMKSAFSYISSVSIAVIIYQLLCRSWNDLSSLFDKISAFMMGITPGITALYVLNGNITTASVSNAGTSILLYAFESLCNYGIKPILQICFGLSVIACFCDVVDLRSICSFVKGIYTTVLVTVITFMTVIMSMQHMLASAGDSLALKSIKFVCGSSIPLVGGSLSEAMSTVVSGVGVIKTTFGVLAIICIIVMILPTVFMLWANKLCLNFGGMVCGVFGLGSEGEIMKSAIELLNFALAILLSISAMFIINLALFCKAVSPVA